MKYNFKKSRIINEKLMAIVLYVEAGDKVVRHNTCTITNRNC